VAALAACRAVAWAAWAIWISRPQGLGTRDQGGAARLRPFSCLETAFSNRPRLLAELPIGHRRRRSPSRARTGLKAMWDELMALGRRQRPAQSGSGRSPGLGGGAGAEAQRPRAGICGGDGSPAGPSTILRMAALPRERGRLQALTPAGGPRSADRGPPAGAGPRRRLRPRPRRSARGR